MIEDMDNLTSVDEQSEPETGGFDMSGFEDSSYDADSNSTPGYDAFGYDDDDPLNATGVSRKSLVIFFLIDTSGSMKGTKMGELNTVME
ncbi:MAG: hypothetical protein IKN55_02775, partial [Oscillospiraceae bacterium]|nr:hypothetical protein [Oscillospiraceae bacterium]